MNNFHFILLTLFCFLSLNGMEKETEPIGFTYPTAFETIAAMIRINTQDANDALQPAIAQNPWLASMTSPEGDSLIHEAAVSGNIPCLSLLYTYPSNKEGYNEAGHRPLHGAVLANRLTSIRNLVTEGGVDVNAPTSSGSRPLHIAAQLQLLDVIDLLLKLKADPNLPIEGTGITPLHVAAKFGHNNVAHLLVSCGASKTSCAFGKYTPHDIAYRNNNRPLSQLLAWYDNCPLPGDDNPQLTSPNKAVHWKNCENNDWQDDQSEGWEDIGSETIENENNADDLNGYEEGELSVLEKWLLTRTTIKSATKPLQTPTMVSRITQTPAPISQGTQTLAQLKNNQK